MSRFALSVATVLLLGASITSAHAQCSFPHPKKAGKFQASLTQAFLGCDYAGDGYTPPNAATQGGIPACKPPETFNQLVGDPSSGWRWDKLRGSGQVLLKPSVTFPPSVLNPVNNTSDMAVRMKLAGVVDAIGPASSHGTFAMILRVTLNDRINGDLTTVDLPAEFDVVMTGGKANVKTTLDAFLNTPPFAHPGLPKCASVEVVSVVVLDPELEIFATPGLFLP